MKNKLKKTFMVSLLLAVFILILSYYLIKNGSYLEFFGIHFDEFFQALFFFPAVIVVISIILFFTKENIIKSWFRFAKYYVAISAILIVLSPSIDGSIFGFDREFTVWSLAFFFLLISLIIIARKWWKERNHFPSPPLGGLD